LLAQPRLTLPALSPHTTRRGAWALQLSALWANSFSWTQDEEGEEPEDRRFLIDGEALSLDLTVRRGLGRNLDVGLRVPFQARGGGVLDGFIDGWHRLAHTPTGTPRLPEGRLSRGGRDHGARPLLLERRHRPRPRRPGLETRWRVRDGERNSASVAVVGRVSLPRHQPFGPSGVGGGGQVVVDAPIGRSFDLYGGVGFTAQGRGPLRGVEYAPVRGHAFVAVEWRPFRRFSLVGETNAASRLVENVDSYPGVHWIVNVTGRIDLGERARLDLGFTENLISQLTTTDFAFYVAFALRP
jgi:hypothetical protein